MFTIKSSSDKMKYFLLLILVLQIYHGNCKQKNILFLVADDMRPNLGAYEEANSEIFGQPPMYTPNLDALASKSLVFEKAYDAQALCSPSRTSTLTSRRPDTTRITRLHRLVWSGLWNLILRQVKLDIYILMNVLKGFFDVLSNNFLSNWELSKSRSLLYYSALSWLLREVYAFWFWLNMIWAAWKMGYHYWVPFTCNFLANIF